MTTVEFLGTGFPACPQCGSDGCHENDDSAFVCSGCDLVRSVGASDVAAGPDPFAVNPPPAPDPWDPTQYPKIRRTYARGEGFTPDGSQWLYAQRWTIHPPSADDPHWGAAPPAARPVTESSATKRDRAESQSICPSRRGLYVPVIPDGCTALEGALLWIGAGWYVLPVAHGKHPGSVVHNDWPNKSSRDPEQIERWFAGTPYAIALHCGRSGAVAFDVDTPEKLPEILRTELAERQGVFQSTRVNQPLRGHYPYALPEGFMSSNSGGDLGGDWGEVRGRNGVIVVAPSIHPGGGRYLWERTGELPVLPDTLRVLLREAGENGTAATPEEVGEFVTAHATGTRTELLGAVLDRFNNRAPTASRHNTALDCACQIARESAAGMYSAEAAFNALGALYLPSKSAGSTRTITYADWWGIVTSAIGYVKPEDVARVRSRLAEYDPTAELVAMFGGAL